MIKTSTTSVSVLVSETPSYKYQPNRLLIFVIADSIFEPKDIDLENGDMDEDEKEIEAFKRFCFNSVPAQRRPINFDMSNISLNKK